MYYVHPLFLGKAFKWQQWLLHEKCFAHEASFCYSEPIVLETLTFPWGLSSVSEPLPY